MKNRVILEQQLKEYPDVVSIAQCQKLLGGIGQATVMKLIKAKRLPSVFVKNQYLISKAGIIDFLVSGDYTETGCTAKQRREENERYKQMIVAYLAEYQKGQKADFNRLLMPVLPANLTDIQKQHKVSKLLAALRRHRTTPKRSLPGSFSWKIIVFPYCICPQERTNSSRQARPVSQNQIR